MNLLTIDMGLAKNDAWALFVEAKDKYYVRVGEADSEYNEIFTEIPRLFITVEPYSLIITEQPYYQMNIKTYGEFWEKIGYLRRITEELGVMLGLVRPTDWKRKLKVSKNNPNRKQIIYDIFSQYNYDIADVEALTDDQIDAVLMGHYYIKYIASE